MLRLAARKCILTCGAHFDQPLARVHLVEEAVLVAHILIAGEALPASILEGACPVAYFRGLTRSVAAAERIAGVREEVAFAYAIHGGCRNYVGGRVVGYRVGFCGWDRGCTVEQLAMGILRQ